MTTILFIDQNIPDYQVFLDGVNVTICDFKNQIFDSDITRIGFVWENNKRQIPFGSVPYEYEQISEMIPDQIISNTTHYFTKEFVDYLFKFNHSIIVDLISCSLNSPVFASDLEQIKIKLPNVTFNYSINLTGNEPYGDWIMESSGRNIKSIYFNDMINNYSQVLALPNSATLGTKFTYSDAVASELRYTLNTAFTISDATTWTRIDITHSDAAIKVIVDGAGLKITVTQNNFDGMFLAGNSNTDTYATELINFNFESTTTATNISTLLARTNDYLKITNSKAIVNSNINADGGVFAYFNNSTVKKITLTNSYVILNGNIGGFGGSLIGIFNIGGSAEIDCCYSIVNGNIEEYAGGLVGCGLGWGSGQTLRISNTYIVFNGSILSNNSGIFCGYNSPGNNGTINIANNLLFANITNIDGIGRFVYPGPGTFTYAGSKNYILDLQGSRTNLISNYGINSIWTKYTTYNTFISQVNANLKQLTDKFTNTNYKIIYGGTEYAFPSLQSLNIFDIVINTIAPTFQSISIPTNVTGTSGNTQVELIWTAPAVNGSNGGSAIKNYSIQYSINSGTSWQILSSPISNFPIRLFCKDEFDLYIGGIRIGSGSGIDQTYYFNPTININDVIAIKGNNTAGEGGLVGTINNIVTNSSDWKFSKTFYANWTLNDFDDSSWSYTTAHNAVTRTDIPNTAQRIWSENINDGVVYFRYRPAFPNTNRTITSLTNGTNYIFKVAAINSLRTGSYSSESTQVTPASTVPIAPTMLIGTAGNNRISLTWAAPASNGTSAITDYSIQYSSDSGSSWTTFDDGPSTSTSTTATVTSLINDTSYIFRVRAVNSSGTSSYSSQSANIICGIQLAPTSIIGTGGNTQVELNWVAPTSNGTSDVTDYSIQYSLNSGSSWTTFARAASTTVTATVTNLTNGTIYIFRVGAVNSIGTSSYSSQSAQISTLPNVPINIRGTGGNTEVVLNWNAPTSNGNSAITDYSIQYSSDSGTTWTIFSHNASTNTNATINNLINGTIYFFKVGTVNSSGISSYSSQSAQISTLPNVPINIQGTGGNTQVVLNWDAPTSNDTSAITDYSIQYSSNSGTTWTTFAHTASTNTTATITNLTNGTIYVFRVGAVNSSGIGPYSSQSAQISTLPNVPINIRGAGGNTQVVLNWDAPTSNGTSAITDYSIQYSSNSGSTWTTFAHTASTSTTATVTNLTNGTIYVFQVGTVNSTGISSYSSQSAQISTLPNVPMNIRANGGNTEIVLNWDAPTSNGTSDITDYSIQYSLNSGTTWTTFSHTASISTTATVPNLTNGTIYTFRVGTVNSSGISSYSSLSAQTSTLPNVPINIIGTGGNTQVVLNWGAPTSNGNSAITDYSIQYSSNNGISWTTFARAASTTVTATVTNLTNGTIYVFRVGAVNLAGIGSYSSQSAQISTLPNVPINPIGTGGNTEVVLSWNAPTSNGTSTITDYSIQYSSNSGSTWTTFAHTASTSTTATVTNLTNGTIYVFQVGAVNSSGIGSYSSQSAQISTLPNVPINIKGTSGNNQIVLNWDAPTSNGNSTITDYSIQYLSNSRNTWTTFEHTASTNTTATITNLNNGTSYIFKVGAINLAGISSYSSQSNSIICGTQLAPTNITGTGGNNQIALNWTAPTSNDTSVITDYSIQYSSNSGTTWTTFTHTASTITNASVTNLTNGTIYIFRVGAVNSAGIDSYSSQSAQISTLPNVPINIRGTSGNTEVVLNWDAPTSNGTSAITNYTIEYSSNSGSTWTTFTRTASTITTATVTNLINETTYVFQVAAVNLAGLGSYSSPSAQITLPNVSINIGMSGNSRTITGLTNGTTYVFKVRAVNNVGTGSYSIQSDNIICGTQKAPTALTGTNVNIGEVYLTWNAPTSNDTSAITNYQIQYSANSQTNWQTIPSLKFPIYISCGNSFDLYFGGQIIGNGTVLSQTYYFNPDINLNDVIAIKGTNTTSEGGLIGIFNGIVTKSSDWKFSKTLNVGWYENNFDDSSWSTTLSYNIGTRTNIPTTAQGIWSENISDSVVYFRYRPLLSTPVYRTVSDLTTTSRTITNLTNQTNYVFKVATINSFGTGLYGEISSQIMPKFKPSVPTNVSGIRGNATVSLTWNIPTSNGGSVITNYIVQYSNNAGISWNTFSSAIITNNTIVTGLTNGFGYVFQVAAINSIGTSVYSIKSSEVIPGIAPTAPASITGTPGNGNISLSWALPASNGGYVITKYILQYSNDTGVIWITFSSEIITNNIIITGLTNGASYSFQVAAINSIGTSVYKKSSTIIPVAAPAAPTSIIGTPGNGNISLSWVLPTSNGGSTITNYIVQYSNDNGTSWIEFSNPINTSTTVIVTGLTNGTGYIFKVAAVNSINTSPYSVYSDKLIPLTVPGIPTGVTGTRGNTIVNLLWDAPANQGSAITDYRIQYKLNSASSWTTFARNASTLTTATVTGLINGNSYVFQIAAINSVGTSNYSSASSVIVPATVPNLPTGLTGISGNTTVSLTWLAPTSNGGSAITEYAIEYSINNSLWIEFKDSITNTTLNKTVTGLTNGILYFFRVKAINEVGSGAFSTNISITPSKPDPPTNITGVFGNRQIHLSWNIPNSRGSNITNYLIQYSNDNGTNFNVYTHSTITSSNNIASTIVTALTNGTAYLFKIAAINAVDTSDFSNISNQITPATVSSVPIYLTGESGNSAVSLIWSPPTDNGGSSIINYIVSYSSYNHTNWTDWTIFLDVLSNTTSKIVTGLSNGIPYKFKVAAVNIAGSSSSSEEFTITPGTPPAPTNITGTIGNGQIPLQWTAPANPNSETITGYNVQYSNDNGTNWVLFNILSLITTLVTTVTNLSNGTPYVFRVVAVYQNGSSDYGTRSRQYIPMAPPPAPIDVTGTFGNTQVMLKWSLPVNNSGSDIINYIIDYSSDYGTIWNTFSDGIISNTTSKTITNLLNGTSYIFKISAVNSAGPGSYSSNSAPVTPAQSPNAPTTLLTTSGDSLVLLSWTAPINNGGSTITNYIVEYSSNNGTLWVEFPSIINTALNKTITGLSKGTSYIFKVRAVNIAGPSLYSSNSVAVIPMRTPDAPSALITTSADSQVSLAWTAPTKNGGSAIINYIVEYSSNSGTSWDVFQSVANTTPNKIITGLSNGTKYMFKVAAVNSKGTGSYILSSTQNIPFTKPNAPTSVIGIAKNTSVLLLWTAPANNGGLEITNYIIEYSTNSIDWIKFTKSQSANTSISVTNLINGSTYIFRVLAVNDSNNLSNSNNISSSSIESQSVIPGIADKPTDLTPLVTNGQIYMSWNAPTNNGGFEILNYSIEYFDLSDNTSIWNNLINTTNSITNTTITGLIPGKTYKFRVSANNIMRSGLYSNESLQITIAATEAVQLAATSAAQQAATTAAQIAAAAARIASGSS